MAKPRRGDEWPTSYEYEQALLRHRETISDPDIRNSQLLKTTETKPARLNGSGSQYVCVYRLESWIIRFFASDASRKPEIKPPEDIVQRYDGIIDYLGQPGNNLPFLIKQRWIEGYEEGIKVRGIYFPFLKLPYIDPAKPLGQFLNEQYDELKDKQQLSLFPRIAEVLAQEWLQLIQQLESKGIAHGDLDTSNILVKGMYPALSLSLIDYDGMYVPSFAGKRMAPADKGHWNFQPVQESLRIFGPELDRFSALIVYLSLRALVVQPSLWEDCGGSESSLLLGRNDYEQLGQSKNFKKLYQAGEYDSSLKSCLNELQRSYGQRMPRGLSEILNVYVPPIQDQRYSPVPPVIPVEWAIKGQVPPQPQQYQPSYPPPPPPAQPYPPTRPPYYPPNPPTQPSRLASGSAGRRLLVVALIILIVVIVTVIIYASIHASSQNQQPSLSGSVLLVAFAPLLAPDACLTEEESGQKRNPDDA